MIISITNFLWWLVLFEGFVSSNHLSCLQNLFQSFCNELVIGAGFAKFQVCRT